MRWKQLAEQIMAQGRMVDWTQCRLVESVAGKVAGVPVLKGTRMPVETILDNYDAGMMPTEIAEQWEITLSDVHMILEYRENQIARSAR